MILSIMLALSAISAVKGQCVLMERKAERLVREKYTEYGGVVPEHARVTTWYGPKHWIFILPAGTMLQARVGINATGGLNAKYFRDRSKSFVE